MNVCTYIYTYIYAHLYKYTYIYVRIQSVIVKKTLITQHFQVKEFIKYCGFRECTQLLAYRIK